MPLSIAALREGRLVSGASRLAGGRNMLWLGRLGAVGAVVVKVMGAGAPLRALRSLWETPRAVRAAGVATRLLASGAQTPAPLAVWVERRAGIVAGAALLTRPHPAGEAAQDLRTLLREAPSPEARDALIDGAARLVRRMHEAGVMHRDLTLGNIVGSGPEDLALVDLNRARCFSRALSATQRYRDLAAMRVCPCPSIGEGYPKRRRCDFAPPCGRRSLWSRYQAAGPGPAPGDERGYLRAVARAKSRFYWDTRLRFWTRHRHPKDGD